MRSQTPKVLHDLCGAPMIAWPVRAARQAGAGRVVVVDSAGRPLEGMLEDGVELAVQGQPDGTGGAVLAGLAHLRADAARAAARGARAPILVLSGDVPLVSAEAIRELSEAHVQAQAAATIATTSLEDPGGYGRVVRDSSGAFERVVETKGEGDATPSELEIREVNTGIYAFDAGALEEFLPRLTADNAQGELYLPQVLALLGAAGRRVVAHAVQDRRLVLGVNDRIGLARVRKLAQAAIHERHMTAGVTVVDPDATVIDVDVQIGQDTVIEPFSAIRGQTRIGAGCLVRHSYLVDCTLEDGASAGPFAYLRPGTMVRADAKIGTFVEVKNSDIGARAKVPHLSYVGDADVGEETNLGAGSITANYDGREKHRTTIGSRVRGGVDTSYVAPVEVGDDSYTAAGSVITEDVPPGSLAVARARQRNVEDYAGPGEQDRQGAGLHSEEP